MATKLKDMNAWDMMGALAELAEPVGRLASDDLFWDAFVECTKSGIGLKQKNGLRFFLQTYSNLFPILMGEEHRGDTFRILAIVQGVTVSEVAKMSGAELLSTVKEIFHEVLVPFFTSSGLSGITG